MDEYRNCCRGKCRLSTEMWKELIYGLDFLDFGTVTYMSAHVTSSSSHAVQHRVDHYLFMVYLKNIRLKCFVWLID